MKTIIYAVQPVPVDTFAHWDTDSEKKIPEKQPKEFFNL